MATDEQIQSLVNAFGEFRQEMGTHVGSLKTGQEAIAKSFDEFKEEIKTKVDKHEVKINRAEGSIGTWKYIFGAVGLSGLLDAVAHLMKWSK